MRSRLTNLWLGTATVVTACLAAPAGFAQTALPEIKIGVVADVTGYMAQPTRDALEGINAWVKIHGVPGKKVVLDVVDGASNPVNAGTLYRRFADDKAIPLVLALVNSTSGMSIKAFASEEKTPVIVDGGSDRQANPPDPWLFKIVPTTHDFMQTIIDFAVKHGYKTIAIIYSNDTFGESEYNELSAIAPKAGVTLLSESYDDADLTFNTQVAKIRADNAEMVYSDAASRAAIEIFNEYHQLGIKAPLMVTQAALTLAFYNGIGGTDKANGTMVVGQRGNFGKQMGGDTAKFLGEMETGLGHPAPFFSIEAFDTGLIAGAAIEKSDGTRQGIRDALESLKDLPAINGPVSYAPDHHTGQDARSLAVGTLDNGVAKLVN